jgi:hypothetical protein
MLDGMHMPVDHRTIFLLIKRFHQPLLKVANFVNSLAKTDFFKFYNFESCCICFGEGIVEIGFDLFSFKIFLSDGTRHKS